MCVVLYLVLLYNVFMCLVIVVVVVVKWVEMVCFMVFSLDVCAWGTPGEFGICVVQYILVDLCYDNIVWCVRYGGVLVIVFVILDVFGFRVREKIITITSAFEPPIVMGWIIFS